MEVLNLYSYRATKPADLWKSGELEHPPNDMHLIEAISGADKIIVSWKSMATATAGTRPSSITSKKPVKYPIA